MRPQISVMKSSRSKVPVFTERLWNALSDALSSAEPMFDEVRPMFLIPSFPIISPEHLEQILGVWQKNGVRMSTVLPT